MNNALAESGDVKWEWVKLMVGGRGTKNAMWFNGSPGYHEIARNGDNVIFAFKRPLDDDNPLPHSLEKCTEFEVSKLNKKENHHAY